MDEFVVDHYITLVVEKKLDKDLIKKWYQTVKKNAPDGTVTGAQVVKPGYGRTSASLVYTTDKNKHLYKVPLSRDFTNKEVEKIIDAWIEEEKDLDFQIETGVTQQEALHQTPDDAIEVSEDTYRNLCETLAKFQHNKWYKERTAQGWTYGTKLSHKNKTHPMLRPWEQLPDDYRKIDYELPKVFMKLLNEMGFVVLDKSVLKDLGWES